MRLAKVIKRKTDNGYVELEDDVPLGREYHVSDKSELRCRQIGRLTFEELTNGSWRDSKNVIWIECVEDMDGRNQWLPVELLEISNE